MEIRTKADFRALRESVGLTQQDVADEAGVSVRTVKRWEAPDGQDAPDDVVSFLIACKKSIDIDVSRYVDVVHTEVEEGATVMVPYYRTQEDLDAVQIGQGADMPVGFVNALSRKIAERLDAEGYDVFFEYSPHELDDSASSVDDD